MLASTYPRWRDDVEPGFVHELSRRLTEDFDVTVLCPHAKGSRTSEIMDGVHIRRYRYAPGAFETLVNSGGVNGNLKRSRWKLLLVPFFMAAQLWATVMTIYRLKPDVIHVHWIIPQGFILCIARMVTPGIPFMLTSHGADLFTHRSLMMSQLKSWVLKQASFVTVVSEPMRQRAMSLGVAEYKLAVMPMGVDFDKFTTSDHVARNQNEILFVGRLVEKKGLSYLIRALALVRHDVQNVKLTIIGFGPEQESLQKLVTELGLDGHVDFIGAKSQSDIVPYYRGAALFVAPFIEAVDGDQEGLGLVTIEAAACGCRVLVGMVAAVADLPVQTVDVTNREDFSKAILDALALRDDGNSQMLRDRLQSMLAWPKAASCYASMLGRLANKP